MGSLAGRVAIVTGAGRGIGASVARRLAHEGALVVANDLGVSLDGGTPSSAPAEEVVAEILEFHGNAIADGSDVADPAAVDHLVAGVVERYGRLDILVNCAGILRDRMIFNMSDEDWDAVIRVHLKGHFNTIRAASRFWRANPDPAGNRRIINFTSDSGLLGAAGQPNYAAAKMGVVGLTYSCAHALGKYGVTTNAIAPGAATRMTAASPVDRRRHDQDDPVRHPDNVAPIVAYLAGDESAWCNGRVIGAQGYGITLYSNPEVIARVDADAPWQLQELSSEVEKHFMPVVTT